MDREHGWRPGVAAEGSDSLERCLRCLLELEGPGPDGLRLEPLLVRAPLRRLLFVPERVSLAVKLECGMVGDDGIIGELAGERYGSTEAWPGSTPRGTVA